jgi:hypothetical protein
LVWRSGVRAWLLVLRTFRRFHAARVVTGGQQPDSVAERYGARQLQVRLSGYNLGTFNGQRGGDVTVPGLQRGQSPSADVCQQRADVQDDRQLEVDAGHAVIVHEDGDIGLLRRGHPMVGETDQFDAAWDSQRAPCGGGEVLILAPPSDEDLDQVDVEQPRGCGCRLACSGGAGRLRKVLQGMAQSARV